MLNLKTLLPLIVITFIVVGGGFFVWQQGWLSGMLSLQTKKQLDIEQIKNTEIYSDNFKERVALVDGRYERRYPEGASELYVSIDSEKPIFGDLDNDGINEAASIAYWSGGGSGTWRELVILKNKDGYPIFVTSKDLGGGTIINSLTVDSGVITLDMNIHGPEDAMCCPTLKKVAQYKLVGTELVETKETSTPSITVTILSPNGEEVLELGKTYQINWSCSDVLAASFIARIYLLLNEQIPHGTIDGTPEAYNKIAGCPIEGGKLLWKVGEVERGTVSSGNRYRIKVDIFAVIDGKEQLVASDISDGYFSIAE